MLERYGRLPSDVVACVGGGSNAMGIFAGFIDDPDVRLWGVEAAGEGIESGKTAAALAAGSVGVLHGSRSYLLQNDDGQVQRNAFDQRRPRLSRRRSRARVSQRNRARDLRAGNRRAGARSIRRVRAAEGIVPALESAHAIAFARNSRASADPDDLDSRQLSAAAATKTSRRCASGRRDEAVFERARSERRAAFIPYVMAGDPDLETTAADHRCAGATPAPTRSNSASRTAIRSPTARRSPRPASRALESGRQIGDVLELVRRTSRARCAPIVLFTYYNPVLSIRHRTLSRATRRQPARPARSFPTSRSKRGADLARDADDAGTRDAAAGRAVDAARTRDAHRRAERPALSTSFRAWA